MQCDPTRVCELLVGLGDVEVLGFDDSAKGPLRVHIRGRVSAGTETAVRAMRRAGVVQGRTQRRAGGPAGVRADGAAGVAQAPLTRRIGRSSDRGMLDASPWNSATASRPIDVAPAVTEASDLGCDGLPSTQTRTPGLPLDPRHAEREWY